MVLNLLYLFFDVFEVVRFKLNIQLVLLNIQQFYQAIVT